MNICTFKATDRKPDYELIPLMLIDDEKITLPRLQTQP